MKRREFISLLGGAAAAWPLVVKAQQAERTRRIGVLMNLAADDPEALARLAAFHQGLQEAGWAVGRNLRIEYRWGAGDADRFRRYGRSRARRCPGNFGHNGALVATGDTQRAHCVHANP